MKTIAIGDVHGCIEQLEEVIQPLRDTHAEVVFLGDLFDRSPEPDGDYKVLQLVKELKEHPEKHGLSRVITLAGNHEMMLLDAIQQGPESDAYDLWEYNGGSTAFYHKAEEYYNWFLDNLQMYHIAGDYLFVHAGVRPGVPLADQTDTDLVWIRDPFLNAEDHGLPYTIVHGHTIVEEVDIQPKRINLDTGCFYTGNLSSMEFEHVI